MSSAAKKVLSTWGTCATEGCGREISTGLRGHCDFHESLRLARELSKDELDDLRKQMDHVTPITEDERAERLRNYSLWSVGYHAESLRAAEALAVTRGATSKQIAEARLRGDAK